MSKLILLICIFNFSFSSDIIASIKPLASLVQGVVGNSDEVKIIVNSSDIHGFSLKPSSIRMINKAKIIFYIDDKFEVFLAKALRNFRNTKVNVSQNIKILGKTKDYHIWLNTNNAKKIISTIEKELTKINPNNAKLYKENAIKVISKIKKLKQYISNNMKDVKSNPFVVYHNAYKYYENEWGLSNKGSFDRLSVQKIRYIQNIIKKNKINCMIVEPNSKKLKNIFTDIQMIEINPLGLNYDKNLYFKMMENLSINFKKCLIK